jgi:hypothetical protein
MCRECLSRARGHVCAPGVLAGCALGLILGAGALIDLSSSKMFLMANRLVAAELATPVTLKVAPEKVGTLRSPPPPSIPDASESYVAARGQLEESYGHLPLRFEENQGQTDGCVKFVSRGRGYTLFLTSGEAVLALRQAVPKHHQPIGDRGERDSGNSKTGPSTVLRVKLVGAKRAIAVRGENELSGKSNYFIGNDPKKWRTNVRNYERVKYENVYRGVDLVYYGHQGELESDFIVAARGDASAIRLEMAGAERVSINGQGDLELATAGGEVVLDKPVVYQRRSRKGRLRVAAGKHFIEARYVMKGKREVGFALARYDATEPLIIDPVLRYSTYLGGTTFDYGNGIVVDGTGNAFVAGATGSSNFPTANALAGTSAGGDDAFVTKFNTTGNALVYSTYLGGNGFDTATSIAVDHVGNAYVTGQTQSTNFPTASPFQAALVIGASSNAFVTKLNAAGNALVYSTYLGGGVADQGNGIAVDSSGNAYVVGQTVSTNFPTLNAFQAALGGPNFFDAFVTKLNAAGNALLYSTYLGGSGVDIGSAIAVDPGGNAYVTGYTSSTNFPTRNPLQSALGTGATQNAFVTKLDAVGNALFYSTYLGGSVADSGNGIAIDVAGNAYVTGFTQSSNFPTANPFQPTKGKNAFSNAFVTKVNPAGSVLTFSTYLGGTGGDVGYAITVDAVGNAYVTGSTFSSDFPTVSPLQSSCNATCTGFSADAFVAKLNAAGTGLAFSTYFGGNGNDVSTGIAVDAANNAYVTGSTQSSNLPTLNPFQASCGTCPNNPTAFVAKIFVPEGSPASISATGGTPQSTPVNGIFPNALAATVTDSSGNAVPGVNVTFAAPASGASGTFGSQPTLTVTTDAHGIATTPPFFANSTPGHYIMTATVTGVPTAADFSLTNIGSPASITETSGSPQGATINTLFAISLTTTVKDSTGDTVPGVNVTFTAPASGASGTFAGGSATATIATNAQGIATAPAFTANSTPGSYTVTAAVTGVVTPANFFLTNNPGPPASVTATGGSSQSATINAAFANSLAATVRDGSGNAVPGFVVRFAAPTSGPTGTFAGGSATAIVATNALGIATAPAFTADSTLGSYIVSATVTGVATPANFSLTNLHATTVDFDGDGRADITVWRPSLGDWFIIPSITPTSFRVQQWGTVGDIPVPGDYDGDGKTDIAVFRPSSGTWFILPSSKPGTFIIQQWGTAGDIPVPGDYDGDGKTDFGVFRPSNGTWYVIPSSNPSAPIVRQWGTAGDTPVPGDYDGDGKTDFAVFRPSSGTWFITQSGNPSATINQQWGTNGDLPVTGDYDGDGKTDVAVFRPSLGMWFIVPSSKPSLPILQQWGTSGDVPVPADYDRDRKTDIAVWRPSSGTWFIIPSSTPTNVAVTQWGTSTDVPVQKPIGQ